MSKELEASMDNDDWGVVFTSAGKFVGKIKHVEKRTDDDDLPVSLYLFYAQEITDNSMPRQAQTKEGHPTVVFERFIQVRTVSNCLDVEETSLILKPTVVIYFARMSSKDKEWHKNLVRTGIRNATEQRARVSGILTPGDTIATGHA